VTKTLALSRGALAGFVMLAKAAVLLSVTMNMLLPSSLQRV
jgi:hypothetical protein